MYVQISNEVVLSCLYWSTVGGILVNWYIGQLLVVYWSTVSGLLVNWYIVVPGFGVRSSSSQVPGHPTSISTQAIMAYWSTVSGILVNYQWYIGPLLLVYWSTVSGILVNC